MDFTRRSIFDQCQYREFGCHFQYRAGTLETWIYGLVGDIAEIRKAIIAHSKVPVGTVPIHEALSRVWRVEDSRTKLLLEVIEYKLDAWAISRKTRVIGVVERAGVG